MLCDEFLTADEVAAKLKIQPSTVKTMTREGKIPAIKITSRVIRYNWEEVEKAISQPANG